jgi:hypothetical protein
LRASGLDQLDADQVDQPAVVKNEMSRRKLEAAKLRDEAVAKRRLAQAELEEADRLDNDASRLSGRAANLESQAQARQADADSVNASSASSPLAGADYVKVRSNASIATSAAAQLGEDITTIRRQAEDKRRKAASLQAEAAHLDQTAGLLEVNRVTESLSGNNHD